MDRSLVPPMFTGTMWSTSIALFSEEMPQATQTPLDFASTPNLNLPGMCSLRPRLLNHGSLSAFSMYSSCLRSHNSTSLAFCSGVISSRSSVNTPFLPPRS